MKLLINESPLQIIPSLAQLIGLNEAIVLQQVHFRSLISHNEQDGYKWVHNTYDEWKRVEFPFWSVDTIKRTIRRLEKSGCIVSSATYNHVKTDKTKWYRIDYGVLHDLTLQIAPIANANTAEGELQIAPNMQCNLPNAIPKEVKSIKKNSVEQGLDVVSVIDYLNEKANKEFKTNSKATERFVNARYREGYTLDDFKKVIDVKVKQWLNNPQWLMYLRPSTLFSATNFENYLEEAREIRAQEGSSPKPFELDFSKGEE
ncbi:conserved phage C-terminal domain-containing protein [Sporosarcina siberiensis]|uniref:Conserved phage C-terminal domain-containing protein n=1 Tax=Sporosarcina siberiensis TaxID=1365606 RepID=A0ABW4SL66_9BACL